MDPSFAIGGTDPWEANQERVDGQGHDLDDLSVGNRLSLEIEDIAAGGEGVGKHNGFVIFVPSSAPGDILEVELISVKKKYGRARISKICLLYTSPSPRD